jgi:hypothetical protein
MSEKKMDVSIDDLKGAELKKTSTKAQQSDMKLVLKCEKCSKTYEWPICCGQEMEYDESGKVKCTLCDKTEAVQQCCDVACKPAIVKN